LTQRSTWLLLGILCLITVLFFLWRLDGNVSAFLYRPGSDVSDLTVTFWPNVRYIRETWRTHGQIPLWRTLIFSGSPFDADPQSGLWYPANVVFGIFPTAAGFNLLFIAHTVWAGLGMWTWSRATGTSSGGALLAALAYAFAPKTFAHLGFGHVGLVYAAAWVPWALRAAYLVGRGSRRHVIALGVAVGLQFIAHPQLAFYTGVVSGTYGLATALHSSLASHRTRRIPQISRLLLSALLALGLTAVQWLPLLRLAPLTARSSMDFAETAVSSLPPRYLSGLILADHRGFMDYMLYVGIPVLALAFLAPRRRQSFFWWAFVCLALVYALGTNTPLYRWAFRLLPGLAWMRAPSRLWFVGAAAVALLAGWGADRVIRGLGHYGRRWLNRIALTVGSLAPALLIGYSITVGRPPVNLIAFGLVTPITALICVVAARGCSHRRRAIAALGLLLVVDLWIVDATLIKGRPRKSVFAQNGVGAYLARQEDQQPYRVYSPSYSLPRHVAARYGLETADGVDPLHLETYASWMEAASGVEQTGYSETVPSLEGGDEVATANRGATPNPELLGLLNVRYVASEFAMAVDGLSQLRRFGSTYLYENEHVLPRAFVVGQVRTVNTFDEALFWLQAHDVGRAAVVEDGPSLVSGDIEAEVAWVRRSPNHLALDVKLNQRGFLVLSQVWYPSWHAEVDGEPVTLWKTNGVLSGVYLEPGRHRVTFTYRPVWTGIGGAISGIAWLGIGSMTGCWIWKRRRGSHRADKE